MRTITTLAFATLLSFNVNANPSITIGDGTTSLTTSKSYSSQLGYDEKHEGLSKAIKRIVKDGHRINDAVGRDLIQDNTFNQLGRWYANTTYSKETIQNSPWVISDPTIRNAWSEGYDGEGVTIKVDDVFETRNPSHIFVINSNVGSHGNHLVNIIKGHEDWNTVGIAPEADIIKDDSWYSAPIRHSRTMYRRDGTPTQRTWVTNGDKSWNDVDIVVSAKSANDRPSHWNSLGSRVNRQKGFDSEKGTLIVQAAGNYGQATADHNPFRSWRVQATVDTNTALYNSQYNDSLILAGTFGGNKAGNFADRYILDDGVATYGNASSWTAPSIAGKAALIMSKFPELTATDTANVIFDTADDLGAPGVDEVYGQGKINLARALSPVGTIR